MDILIPSIADGRDLMTRSQLVWGGTHDALLGLALYLAAIPCYSIKRFYGERELRKTDIYGISRHRADLGNRAVVDIYAPTTGRDGSVVARLKSEIFRGSFVHHKVRDFPISATTVVVDPGADGRSSGGRLHNAIVSQYDMQALFADIPYHTVVKALAAGFGPPPQAVGEAASTSRESIAAKAIQAAAAQGTILPQLPNDADSASSLASSPSPPTPSLELVTLNLQRQRDAGEFAAKHLLRPIPPGAILCTEYGNRNFGGIHPFSTGSSNARNRGADMDVAAGVAVFAPSDCQFSSFAQDWQRKHGKGDGGAPHQVNSSVAVQIPVEVVAEMHHTCEAFLQTVDRPLEHDPEV